MRISASSHSQTATGWVDATSKLPSGGVLHYRIAAVFTPATNTYIDYLCGPPCPDVPWPPGWQACDCDVDWCEDMSSTGPALQLPGFTISVWE